MQTHSPTIHQAPVTWILVADGQRAQIYERNCAERHIPLGGNARHRHYDDVLVHDLMPVAGMKLAAESVEEYELGRDQLGRVFENASSAHHMSEVHSEAHEEIKRRFMKRIAVRLFGALMRKAYDKLVLIAPPKMLGELRAQLDDVVLRHVVAEMPKDLTHCKSSDLLKQLGSLP